MADKVNIFWFRRDLRIDDNVGFYKALHGKFPVLPLFIFDTQILDELPKDDARVTFIFNTLQQMRDELQKHGSSLAMYHGSPTAIFKQLVTDFDIQHVITNHDYEPYAKDRDTEISNFLKERGIGFHTFKDQVIYEKNEVVKDDGDPYVVYTPYMKKWKERFQKDGGDVKIYYTSQHMEHLVQHSRLPNLTLADMGFESSNIQVPDFDVTPTTIQEYEETRNFPSKEGTSRLGPHLRFGTVSIRKMMKKAIAEKNETFWQELIWREFFMQILWHFPETVNNAFRKKYDNVPWRKSNKDFEKWKKGVTGYPLVDAGMRQLNTTGYMHNRVRMVVASFLCKHLLLDWRWGEAYFAEKLLDYELSSNIGNWQWAAGSGVDAAPYFRIFNPSSQLEKFDKDKTYCRQWIEEFETESYPEKMVDHKEARERALTTYKEAIN